MTLIAPLVYVLIALLGFSRTAAEPSDLAGSWESPELKATFSPDAQKPGVMHGMLIKGDNMFDFDATAQGNEVRGTFSHGGNDFQFTAMLQPNGELSLKTGTSTYVLKRAGGNTPPKKRNPLEDDAPAPAPPPPPMPAPNQNQSPNPNPPMPTPAPAPNGAPGVIAVQLWTNDDGFIEVRAVVPGGPADKAGLKAGDVVTAVDGKEIPPSTMPNQIASLRGPVGSTVTLAILRGGRPQQITITRGPGLSAQQPQPAPGPNGPGPNGPGPNGPGPNGPGPGPAAQGNVYTHPQGLYHVTVPNGWTEKPGNDPNSTVWTHAKGGMVFITIIPQAPMQSGEQLFKTAVGPGLQQSGAQIVDGQNFPLPNGEAVWISNFRRNRNNVNELGQTACIVHQGTGMIMQMMMPETEQATLAPDFEQFGQTFDFGKPK